MNCVYGNKQLLWSNHSSIVNVQPHNFYVFLPNQIVLKCIFVDFNPLLTVNGERFAGLNFRGFHGFQEYCESFSVNISASLQLH